MAEASPASAQFTTAEPTSSEREPDVDPAVEVEADRDHRRPPQQEVGAAASSSVKAATKKTAKATVGNSICVPRGGWQLTSPPIVQRSVKRRRRWWRAGDSGGGGRFSPPAPPLPEWHACGGHLREPHGQHGEGGPARSRDEVAAQGVEVTVYPITDIGLKDLAEADIVFIGTWVDGLVLFGQRPGRAGRIKAMPVIDGKRVAAFMTYAINAGKALDRFARVLDERGATVVAAAPCCGATGSRPGVDELGDRTRSTASPVARSASWGLATPRRTTGGVSVRSSTRRTSSGPGPGPRAGTRRARLRPGRRRQRSADRPCADSPSPQVPRRPRRAAAARPPSPTPRTWRSTGPWRGAHPGAPEAEPLARAATVRVAVTERTETVAPLLVAEALGEFAAENLAVEIVDLPGARRLRGHCHGASRRGRRRRGRPVLRRGRRRVRRPPRARRPGGPATQRPRHAQAGLLDPDRGPARRRRTNGDNVEGQTVRSAVGSARSAPSADRHAARPGRPRRSTRSTSCRRRRRRTPSSASTTPASAWRLAGRARRHRRWPATRRSCWWPRSRPARPIDGTVFGPRLLGRRPGGRAGLRAGGDPHDQHLPGRRLRGRGGGRRWPRRTGADEEAGVRAGPAPLFDWEVRAGTTTRIQDALRRWAASATSEASARRPLVDRSL